MIMRRLPAALVLAAVVLTAAASPAAASTLSRRPVQGRVGVRLLTAPVSERANPLARLYIIDHLAPGATLRSKMQVVNMSKSAVLLNMYAAAAAIGHGQFMFAVGHTQNLMTTWVHLSRPVLRLAAGRRANETVAIRVPRNAPPGEQYGVVWASDRGQDPAHKNISLVNRVGIRIYLSVGPGNPPASNFTMASPTTTRNASGRAQVTVQVHNTGGRALTLSGTLSLTGGPGGLRAGPFLLTTGAVIAPGQSAPVVFTLSPHIPDGPWHAKIRLQSGLVVRSETETIDFDNATLASAGFPVVPTAGIVSLIALTALAAFVIRARRPERRHA
jgi:hypothetical protein